MSDPVARAKALLEGVTEGPWVQVGFGNVQRVPAGDFPPVAKAWRTANGEFIAAARTLVPELVAEVERLRAALADVAIDQYMREIADGPWSDPWTEQRADGKADR